MGHSSVAAPATIRRLAIVPGRGGSRRLPGKNVKPLGGRPLINHTVAVAKSAFDLVLVTSDSLGILESVDGGANVITTLRPPSLATDTAKVIDTVEYYHGEYEGHGFDQIWLCLPTCPLRRIEDVLGGQRTLTPDVDGVVSITDFEFPPTLGLSIADGRLTGYTQGHPLAQGDSRSQDQPLVYRPNGAFYGMWWESFRTHRNFYRGRIAPYLMPRDRSIDIDTETDFAIAAVLLALTASEIDR